MKTDEQIGNLMFNIGRLIRTRLASQKKRDPASFLHFWLLTFVFEHKRPTMREITESLHVTPPSATAVVNRLVDSGELRRVAEKKDRRIIKLQLTSRGRRKLENLRAEMNKHIKGLFKTLNENEKSQLTGILKKVINANL